MKLFIRIYSHLLLGMIFLLATDANINYELEIDQFEKDMIKNAMQIGRIVSGMISHTWNENGQETAIQLINDANDANHAIHIRWTWLDELIEEHKGFSEEIRQLETLKAGQSISFVKANSFNQMHRYTFVPVSMPGIRVGALELSQSLTPLSDYTKKILLRSLGITGLLALFSGIIIYFFIHIKIKGPLDRLSSKALQIGKGHIDADIEIQGNDELTDLAKTMNDMCNRLIIAQQKIHFEHEARIKTLEQLRHTERLSTIGRISAGIAHELGTPLNVIDGRAKMIISEDLTTDEIVGCASIIKNQSGKITRIIRQLLDFSRIKKTRKSKEDIGAIVRQVFRLLTPIASKQGAELRLTMDAETEYCINADVAQIQQVLMNLIMNGIQAMTAPGCLSVNISSEKVKSLEKTAGQTRTFQRIDIADEGEGISPEDIKQIFDPFFTTKKVGSGTGLGLSITSELVEEHGGWIEVQSTSGAGTTFSIFLPSFQEKQ